MDQRPGELYAGRRTPFGVHARPPLNQKSRFKDGAPNFVVRQGVGQPGLDYRGPLCRRLGSVVSQVPTSGGPGAPGHMFVVHGNQFRERWSIFMERPMKSGAIAQLLKNLALWAERHVYLDSLQENCFA